MDAVEPNLSGGFVFAAAWLVTALAFYVITGMFPMSSRPEATRGTAGTALVGLNAILFAGILAGTLWYGWHELRWTSLVLIAAFGFLFAPAVFEIWPAGWRDSRGGLLLLAAGQVAVASGLAYATQV